MWVTVARRNESTQYTGRDRVTDAYRKTHLGRPKGGSSFRCKSSSALSSDGRLSECCQADLTEELRKVFDSWSADVIYVQTLAFETSGGEGKSLQDYVFGYVGAETNLPPRSERAIFLHKQQTYLLSLNVLVSTNVSNKILRNGSEMEQVTQLKRCRRFGN